MNDGLEENRASATLGCLGAWQCAHPRLSMYKPRQEGRKIWDLLVTASSQKGYALLYENTSKVVVHHDVIFNETDFLESQKELSMVEMSEVSSPTLLEQQESPEWCEEPERPKYHVRRRQAPVRYAFDEYASTATMEDLLIVRWLSINFPRVLLPGG